MGGYRRNSYGDLVWDPYYNGNDDYDSYDYDYDPYRRIEDERRRLDEEFRERLLKQEEEYERQNKMKYNDSFPSTYSRSEEILRQALEQAKKTIAEQEEVLQQLLDAPTTHGIVVGFNGDRTSIVVPGNGVIEVKTPTVPINGKDVKKLLKTGSTCRMLMSPAPAIIDVLDVKSPMGNVVFATKELSNDELEVDFNGMTRVIHCAKGLKKPEVGDRLLVDGDCYIAIRNLGPDETKFSFQGVTGVSWDDIGGLVQAKEDLREAIELPHTHAELYKKYGKKNVKGVLLYGPPGCGKTMLAKATATALSTIHGKKAADTGFIYVKGPEMLDKYVGNTEAQVRSLFSRARKHQKIHGYPAIIFIDEADALLGKRGARPNMGIESTVVPQFLSEMDGLDDSGAIVLLATNRPDTLDNAVTRDGRIDRKVRVTRPDQQGAEDIFKLYLKNTPLTNGLTVEEAAKSAAKDLYNAKHKLYDLATEDGKLHKFTLAHLANGAMIAGMVDKATTTALRRDIKKARSKSVGLTLVDLTEAAESIFTQNLHLNHEEEVQEYVDSNKLKITQIVRA